MKKKGFLLNLSKIVYLAIILIFLYLPIGTLMVLSFNHGKSMESWQGFSWRWYAEMFNNEEIMEALGNTLTIALWASIIATIIGVMACSGINAMSEKKRSFIMGINNIPLLNADIVTGISIMMSFIMFGISLSYSTVLFAHITFCIPYVILSVMPKFKQLEDNIFEAALDLGASKTYAFFKIILPDIMPGIVSGFLLSFTMSVDDFVITHFTRGAGINTLSTLIYSQLKVGVRPTLFALSTCIFIGVLLILIMANALTASKKVVKEARQGTMKDVEYVYKKGMPPKKIALIAIVMLVFMCIAIFYTPSTPGEVLENGTIYVYNFGDYIDMDLIDEFEEEYGYSVVMDYFDTNEEMYPVIKNDSAHYDVICASDYMIDKLRQEKLIQEIDFENIPNINNLDEKIIPYVDGFDPGMKYSVPHTWGTYGIIYNSELIQDESISKKLAHEINLDETNDFSWSLLWNEAFDGEIIMPNSVRECNMIGAKILGYSMNTVDEREIKEITDLLIEQKPLVYTFANDNARDLMIGNNAIISVITSGDARYAAQENEALVYVIPKDGTEVWTDCWAIPTSAETKDGAEAWINFMLEKTSAEKNFEYLGYDIPNKLLEIEEDVLGLDGKSPFELLDSSTSETLKNLGPDGDDLYSNYWKIFKSK